MALLSVVLPAYNEQQNIAYTTEVLSGLFEQNGIDYELIFVNDGYDVGGSADYIIGLMNDYAAKST